MKVTHIAAAAVLVAAATLAACGGDGRSPKAGDASKSSSAEGATFAHSEHGGSNNAPASPSMKPMTYRELSIAASVDCEDADKVLKCTMGNANAGGQYNVILHPECGEEGFFGAVNNPEGAELWDKPPPGSTAMWASLGKGQVICIQATAYVENTPSRYFVTAVPVAILDSCLGTSLCEKFGYGDRPITWHVPHPGPECRATGPWNYEGVCAMGWVDVNDIDVLPNSQSAANNVRKASGK